MPAPGRSRRSSIRTLLIHAYRRVQLHDPMLPLDLLPQPWPGSDAYALAQAIYRPRVGAGRSAFDGVLRREDADGADGGCGVLRAVRRLGR